MMATPATPNERSALQSRPWFITFYLFNLLPGFGLGTLSGFHPGAMLLAAGLIGVPFALLPGTALMAAAAKRLFVERAIIAACFVRLFSLGILYGALLDFFVGEMSVEAAHGMCGYSARMGEKGFLITLLATTFHAVTLIGILSGLALVIWLYQALFLKPPLMPGVCTNCGYDLRGTPDRCPECGQSAPVEAAGNGANRG